MSAQPKHTNRLAEATSPYLLQHAHNPVDWYPWGPEAIQRARAEDKPIFLSIGYAACHWCHVMERESFENEAVAAVLNRDFVAIKVDREERPDLDEIYMTATQLMTQSGGWPMSVFLTPELKPFYAGTYFPPEDRYGRPGFLTLLNELARFWRERRSDVERQAERVAEAIAQLTSGGSGQGVVTASLLRNAVSELSRGFDPQHGGFGSAPKFPPSMRLELLLRRYREERDDELLAMLETTLDFMARGGMYDQVGGGFHRYSVDERWLVPHFEKMLYDNALLARLYTLAFQETGEAYQERIAREILEYVLREMTHPDGGFYSTTDADSEGEEGKFFVWSPDEVKAVLGAEDGELFCRIYDVTPQGNFEGHSIPNLLQRGLPEWAEELGTDAESLAERLEPLRRKLWEHRERRVHPLLDDKILSGWNGLMIRAFADGYRIFQEDTYLEAAERAADFVLTRMRDGRRLLRSYRNGTAALNAYQEDYAYLSVALLDLYLATGEERWKDEGLALLDEMTERFWDEENGGYFFTSHDHEELITRTKSFQDGATPSGNSMAALALIRAARITGEAGYREQASAVLGMTAPQMAEMAAAFPNMLVAADEYLQTWKEAIRVPGADAVSLTGYLSHTAVRPGERIWIAVRAEIKDGFHINSWQPTQGYLVPTRLVLDETPGFTAKRESYPPSREYRAAYEEEALLIYEGNVLFGIEMEVGTHVSPGTYPLHFTMRLQPCDDQQCYPPLEARMRFNVVVDAEGGQLQHAEVFGPLLEQAG